MNKEIKQESSLTSERILKLDIKNLIDKKQIKDEVQDNNVMEYNYMDGVLGCVKV